MNKSRLWLVLILCAMTVWSYKVFNTAQAFTVAKAELENRTEISQPLGDVDWHPNGATHLRTNGAT